MNNNNINDEKTNDGEQDMLLGLSHISKIYGDLHAVDDISLSVPASGWQSSAPRDRGKQPL